MLGDGRIKMWSPASAIFASFVTILVSLEAILKWLSISSFYVMLSRFIVEQIVLVFV